MTILSALAAHLASEDEGTVGTDIFIDTKPSGVNEAVMIRRTGGARDADYDGKLRRTDVQLIVTGDDYQALEVKAESISKSIRVVQTAFASDGVFIYRCDPDHDPIPVGREDAGVETMVVNCTVIWREQ